MNRAAIVVVGSLFGIIGAVAAVNAFSRPAKAATTSCAPYKWNEATASAAIRTAIADGETDEMMIAAVAADQLFGDHPSGGTAEFPPSTNPKRGVKCVWDKMLSLTRKIIDQEGGTMTVEPWIIVDDNTSPEPNPGMLFHAVDANFPGNAQGSLLGERGVIGRALEQAGVPNTGSNRLALLELTECSPWNHALVNYDNARPSSNFPGYGPNGSGILLNSQHYNNYQRMMEGKSPKRSVKSGGHRPLFWIPAIRRNAPVVVLANNPDGTPGINPPQEILDFGFEDVKPGQYGCDPYKTSIS